VGEPLAAVVAVAVSKAQLDRVCVAGVHGDVCSLGVQPDTERRGRVRVEWSGPQVR
jgi:hypothetical protein